MRKDFIIFILSHGRPNNVKTVDALKRSGYSGYWLIVLDNEDKYICDYEQRFGKEHIIVFDKKRQAELMDTCDLMSRKRNAVVYARNACFEIAKKMNFKYFLELDDDYDTFRSREMIDDCFASIYVRDMDSIIDEYISFLDSAKAHTVAFAQTGDFIGGPGSNLYKRKILRKAMNAFFCRTDRPFKFIGRINEDVNTYVFEGGKGKLFFTPYNISLNQAETQKQAGGMTELYKLHGTYVKSFFSVLMNPSCVKVYEMGARYRRLHHSIAWNNAVPCIIREEHKKRA